MRASPIRLYLHALEDLEVAEQRLRSAQANVEAAQRSVRQLRRRLGELVGANKTIRVFAVGDRAVVIRYQSSGDARVDVLELDHVD